MKALHIAASMLLASTALAGDALRVVRPETLRELSPLERDVREGRPPLRNFFPPLGSGIDAPGAWRSAHWNVPARDREPAAAEAAEFVARRLATDGLLATLAAVVERHPNEARDPEWLARVGLPLDWSRAFTAPDGGDVLAWIAARIASGAKAAELGPELALRPFAPRPSVPGFEASDDSGGLELGALRLQIPSGGYWQARTDGSGVDLARELCEALPAVEVVATIEQKHLEPFLAVAKDWNLAARTAPITIVPQDQPNAQWAQDDGKSGLAGGEVVTLVPRYASRGDEASSWTPGEMRALESFAATGRKAARSPLLFQAGNLIVVRDPKRSERVLLAGEAEILRNTTLGLTQAQAIEAFRVEFGVARVLVLPAIAYHIDYEVSPRVVNGELICLVNDSTAAAIDVLRIAVDVLEREKKLDADLVRAARSALERRDPNGINASFAPALLQGMIQPGTFRESFAKLFKAGAGDSHVANFHRVMLALDVLLMSSATERVSDRYLQGFIDAFQGRDAARRELQELLRAQGWRVVPVPSLSQGARSLTYLNGVHARGLYLMPAWGGLFAPIDAKVKALLEKELGADVRVVPILSGESQRRNGAVRCAVSPLPKS
ncbi:MAG: hypothetical protein IPJ77_04130 [Planctomycetes bacterium]|nr:hypothetical protein [Planctomycetota bacterium]